MNASIIEQSNRSSFVVVTEQDGEPRVFDIMEADSQDELSQFDYELFHGHAVFNYSLLGDPNADAADAEEFSVTDEYETEYA